MPSSDGDEADRPASVLFVCLGNICRSPLAEAAFRKAARDAGLTVQIDSAGTGSWHVGEPPDPRACAVAASHGLDISGYRARQVGPTDFSAFDLILAMDRENLAQLRACAPDGATAKVALLLDTVPELSGTAVDDPYFGGPEGFATTWRQVTRAAVALVERLSGSKPTHVKHHRTTP